MPAALVKLPATIRLPWKSAIDWTAPLIEEGAPNFDQAAAANASGEAVTDRAKRGAPPCATLLVIVQPDMSTLPVAFPPTKVPSGASKDPRLTDVAAGLADAASGAALTAPAVPSARAP